MRLAHSVIALALLLPSLASAHAFTLGERVPAVGVNDKGELNYQQDKFSYKAWNSAQLSGKVRVILHIAGRSSAKEQNAALIEAIKAANLPHDRYQTTTIVNTDDAIPGTAMFVRSSIESNKALYPWSQFIVDSDGNARKAWQLEKGGAAIVILDNTAHVRYVKDGPLTQDEVKQAMTLIHQLLQQ